MHVYVCMYACMQCIYAMCVCMYAVRMDLREWEQFQNDFCKGKKMLALSNAGNANLCSQKKYEYIP